MNGLTMVLPPVKRTSTNMFAVLPDSLSHEYRVSDDRINIEKIYRTFAHRCFGKQAFLKTPGREAKRTSKGNVGTPAQILLQCQSARPIGATIPAGRSSVAITQPATTHTAIRTIRDIPRSASSTMNRWCRLGDDSGKR